MKPQTRIVESAEKPSRLQLAILEWQRQLLRAREVRMAEQFREPRANPSCEAHAC
jgi:hypothetical protein